MKNYLDDLNPKQKEAVETIKGPVLIIAGAGAGKTKTITHRIFHLIKQGVNPQSILAITFTNKAAREMKERVEKMYKNDPDLKKSLSAGAFPFIGTFHALGVHIIKQNAPTLGLPRFFSIYDRNDGKRLIKEALSEANYDPKQFDPGRILHIISKEKGNFVTAEEYAESVGREFFPQVVSKVWLSYEKKLAKEKALDLDDLLLVTARLLKNNSDVRQYYQNLWQYIHIDEYQDTNTVQYNIARLLSDSHHNICVVGDTDQNIYSWRGADIQNMLRFEKDFPKAKMILLEENYRSTERIISVANKVIEKNKYRFEKNLFTKNSLGDHVGLFEAFSGTQEAFFVAEKIRSLIEGGVKPEEIAILYRANFQSRAFEEVFVSLGIPYTLIGTKFFDRKEIKDVIAFIKSSLNRDAWGDIERIINVPARGIGSVTLKKIKEGKLDTLTPALRKKVDSFFSLLDSIEQTIKNKPASEVVKFVLKKTELEETLKKGTEEDHERLENLMELVTIASRYDELKSPLGTEEFLGDVALASSEETSGEKPQAVRLMTVHASKGLEFDYVFIAGLEQDIFPHSRLNESHVSPHEAEEERRLFYVALTRAKKKIFLSFAQTRTIYGQQEVQVPSEFLFDIPQEHIEREFIVARDEGDYPERIIEF